MNEARVVVAGAGPVGLTLAWSLARAGVPVTVCEAGPGPSPTSRASTFHPSTLDLLDDLDITETLLRIGLRAPIFQYRERSAGVVAEFDFAVLADDVRHPFRLQCEQSKLCTILYERLRDHPLVELRFGCAVKSMSDGVAATEGGDLAYRFGVAADGAHSAVRDALGVEFSGFTFDERFLVVSTTDNLAERFDDLALVNYVSDPDEWMVLLRTPDHWRVLFPVGGDESDEDAQAPERVAQRLAGAIPGDAVTVAHTTYYRIHQRVAETFRVGDVLLAGDAAHINNPLGGMGMNSGLHDAVSLSRRLGDVWHGKAADSALDEYASLRRAVAVDIVDAQTRANFATLASPDVASRTAALENLAAVAADPAQARAYLLRTSLVESMRTSL